jgi:hypothetical protein
MPSTPRNVDIDLCIVLLSAGCRDPDTKDPDLEQCTPIPGEPCNETGGGTDDGGEPVALGADECIHNVDPGYVGIMYQCEGDYYSRLELSVGDKSCTDLLSEAWCEYDWAFGTNFQPYPAAKVMACCGEYDAQHTSVYKEFCVYDMFQQICSSLAEHLEAAINDGSFGAYAGQAANVQTWIADHYGDCFTALVTNNTVALPDVDSFWELGDFGDLTGVVMHVDAPSGIDGVNLPSDEAEWISCHGADNNNDQVFEDGHPPNGDTVVSVDLATDLQAGLSGPTILGGTVTATATFDVDCAPHGCPSAEFSYDANSAQFTMEEFDVFDVDPVIITNGSYSISADRVQMRLWAQAVGHEVLDPANGHPSGYEIPAGAAQFLISGSSNGMGSNRFMAVNSTVIWITADRGRWSIDGFDVEFEDGNAELWTITLDGSRWDE